jgi:hypothetical protein
LTQPDGQATDEFQIALAEKDPGESPWHAAAGSRSSAERGIRVPMSIDWQAKLRPVYRTATRLPPVLRSIVGLLLILIGVVGGILPVLGFWMAPVGMLFIALDIAPLRRRIDEWLSSDGS